MDADGKVRARIMEHWVASEQGDGAAEHAIYAADAILDYPQSGERFHGRATIAHETQYFADPFEPPPSRAALAEAMPDHPA